jgi:hypothetical protein
MKKTMNHQIFQTFFVLNTSHWSQPLDNLLFARLKQEIYNSVQEHSFLQVFVEESMFFFIDEVMEATKKAFTFQAIQHSFEITGLWPFSLTKIWKLAEINHSAFSLSSSVTKTIVEQLTIGIQTYLEELQGQAEEKAKTTVKIQNQIQKNRGYNVEDLIRNSIKAEEAKKQAETKKKEQKE